MQKNKKKQKRKNITVCNIGLVIGLSWFTVSLLLVSFLCMHISFIVQLLFNFVVPCVRLYNKYIINKITLKFDTLATVLTDTATYHIKSNLQSKFTDYCLNNYNQVSSFSLLAQPADVYHSKAVGVSVSVCCLLYTSDAADE